MNNWLISVKAQGSFAQLIRYGFVGVVSNLIGYLLYLLLTFFGLAPKLTMTVLYWIGVVISYAGNRRLTFGHKGSLLGSSTRYLLAHGAGYIINLTILIIFVDRFGFAHQWVQAIAIFVVAGFLFIAFKFFVFTNKEN